MLFETMMTTMNEVSRDKTKVLFYFIFFFVMFRLSALLLNSMSKLIHNRFTCKLIISKPKRTIPSLILCLNLLFSVVQF